MNHNKHTSTTLAGLLAILASIVVVAIAAAHPGAQHSVELKVKGTIESIQNDRWMVAGREFLVTRATDIEDYVRVGDYVRVEAEQDANGAWVAKEIDRKRQPWRPRMSIHYKLKGSVEAMVGDTWTVAGMQFQVTPRTSVEDSVFVGSSVSVSAYEEGKGKLVATEVDSKDARRRR